MAISNKKRKIIYSLAESVIDTHLEYFILDIGTEEEEKRKLFILKRCSEQLVYQYAKEPTKAEKELMQIVALEIWNKKREELTDYELSIKKHIYKVPEVTIACIQNNDLEKFKKYINKYDNQPSNTKIYQKALTECVAENYIDGVKYLVETKKTKLLSEDADKMVQKGYMHLLKYYVEQGGDIHSDDEYLIYCAIFHNNIEIQHYLVDIGAEPSKTKDRLESYSERKALSKLEAYYQKRLALIELKLSLEEKLPSKQQTQKRKM